MNRSLTFTLKILLCVSIVRIKALMGKLFAYIFVCVLFLYATLFIRRLTLLQRKHVISRRDGAFKGNLLTQVAVYRLFLRLSNSASIAALLIHVCKRHTCEQGIIFERVERKRHVTNHIFDCSVNCNVEFYTLNH